jgi:putative nucleotidyltransferase with HDIG domain
VLSAAKIAQLSLKKETRGFDTMRIKEELSYIENIEEFPSMPSIVLTLMGKMNDPDIKVAEIVKFINMDPALVSYILRITNSLIFGLREEVYSVNRAVILLGMSNLKSLLTSYSIRLLCKAIRNLHAQEYIWHHSLSVAVMSKVISEKITGTAQPEAYVMGLLHDIGKIVLYMHNPDKFQESLERGILLGMDFVYTETKVFGYSHIEAGYLMVDKLNFSKKMKNVVLFHHDPEFGPAGEKMHWIVSLSNELAHYMDDNKPIDLRRYLEQINVSEKDFNLIIQNATEHIKRYKEIL